MDMDMDMDMDMLRLNPIVNQLKFSLKWHNSVKNVDSVEISVLITD